MATWTPKPFAIYLDRKLTQGDLSNGILLFWGRPWAVIFVNTKKVEDDFDEIYKAIFQAVLFMGRRGQKGLDSTKILLEI